MLRALAYERDPAGAARSLALFRILLGCAVLWQALATARDLPLLVGEFGLIQRNLNDALAADVLPRIRWFVPAHASGWASEKHIIYFLFALYLISVFYLIVGYRTKWFAAASLFFHLLFNSSGSASSYGAHALSTSGLFFCLVLPVGCFYAVRGGKRPVVPDTIGISRFGLRAYMTLVYASSGMEKLSGGPWRNGDAMWNFLMRPEVSLMNFGWISHVPFVAAGLAWIVLAVETGYILCLIMTRIRPVWFFLTLLLHLGIALTIHLWFFSLTMIALNVGALAALRGSPRVQAGRLVHFGPRPVASRNAN
jgi:hypothetical protein